MVVGNLKKEDLSKFQVTSSIEMGKIFKDLQSAGQKLRMTFPGKQENLDVDIVNVDVKNKMLLVDAHIPLSEFAIVLKSPIVELDGKQDKVTISFSVTKLYPYKLDGVPVFGVPFPEGLTRLQRRENFRISVSGSKIDIPVIGPGDVKSTFTAEIRNLSTTGINMVDKTLRFDSTIGKVYTRCQLQLPEVEPITVSIEIRNTFDVAVEGSRQRRIGCRFVQMSRAVEALLQRYITHLERQRRILTK